MVNVYLIYIYIPSLSHTRDDAHYMYISHQRNNTLHFLLYWLLFTFLFKNRPYYLFCQPFFNGKSVEKENVYIFHIFEKIGTFFKTDVYIIDTHVYIHYTTIDDFRPNAIIRWLQRIWISSDRLIDLFCNLYILYAFLIWWGVFSWSTK